MQDELKEGFDPQTYDNSIKAYLMKNYYKTGSLFSNSFKGVGEIMGLEPDMSDQLFDVGAQIGILFQLYDDYLDLVKTSESDKETLKDIRDCIVSLNFYVAFKHLLNTQGESAAVKFSTLYLKPKKSSKDIETAREILVNNAVNSEVQQILQTYYHDTLNNFSSLIQGHSAIVGSQDNFINLVNYVINRYK